MSQPSAHSENAPEKFDDALIELRTLMHVLESDEVSVDTLTTTIRRAAVLLKFCQKELNSTEAEVKQLIQELGVDGSADAENA